MALGWCVWHNLLLKYKTDFSRHRTRACGGRVGVGRVSWGVSGTRSHAQLVWDKREPGLAGVIAFRDQTPGSWDVTALWSWASHLAFLDLHFLTSEMGQKSLLIITTNCDGLQGASGRISA